MNDYLWQYVMSVNPFATKEDVLTLEELNEWDLLIEFKNGKRVMFDRFTGYYRDIFYNDISEITDEQERREFSYRLRSIMGRKRITQEHLANEIGTTQKMISRYVRGESLPSVLMVRKIAKVLDCSMDDFFDKNY